MMAPAIMPGERDGEIEGDGEDGSSGAAVEVAFEVSLAEGKSRDFRAWEFQVTDALEPLVVGSG